MKALIIQFGSEENIYILNNNKTYTIGRKDTNDIIIKDSTISGTHCQITISADKIIITDLNSRNGITVNEKKISGSAELSQGQFFFIGMRNSYITDIPESELFNLAQHGPDHFIRKSAAANNTQSFDINNDFSCDRSNDLSNTIITKISFKDIDKKKLNINTLLSDNENNRSNKEFNKLSIIYEMSKELNTIFSKQELYDATLKWISKGLKYEHGYILMYENGFFNCVANSASHEEAKISKTLAKFVIDEQSSIITLDASCDERFASSQSIASLKIMSAMCAPIWTNDKTIGLIYITNSVSSVQFTDEELKFLTAFANQLSISIERLNLMEALKQEENIRSKLSRYLSPDVADIVIKNPEFSTKLGGCSAEVSILFADIRGFTKLSIATPVDILVTILNEYFSIWVEIVFKHKGTIDKFIGDAVMAVYGAPVSYDCDSANAINSAKEFMTELEKANNSWMQRFGVRIDIGIGISTGPVIAGNIGSQERMDYTIIGSAVNLASRICSSTPAKKIYVCDKTFSQNSEHYTFQQLEPIKFKGSDKLIPIYDTL